MFKRSFRSRNSDDISHSSSCRRIDKSARLKKRETQKLINLHRSLTDGSNIVETRPTPSPIITLIVGREGRLFAAHEDALCQSAFFNKAIHSVLCNTPSVNKRLYLPDEEPEIFSAILEYLYKGDYHPRLLPGKRHKSWELENCKTPLNPTLLSTCGSPAFEINDGTHLSSTEPLTYLSGENVPLLRDTVIYCAADRYGLEELKQLSLRKQGLQSGIDVATILRSATFAYANTPDSDSRLRAHYLALIIRCRKTFKKSGTMQAEMERGGSKLFFDLFVAMCNHLDVADNFESQRVV